MRTSLALLLTWALSPAASAASLDGMPIHSTTSGRGKATIVLVHGWTCDVSSWDAQVPALSKQFRVIALDLPGHGRSGSPKDGKLSMDLFARAVEAVRTEAGADKVVLVGHSMGAPVIGAMNSILDPALRASDMMPMPALAVWAGTAQQMPKVEVAREIMPKFEQMQVPGTGHFLMMEKPDEFNRILTAFVDKLSF
jgi:pimeloyl-ACP methyl ester carboxylesterase